MNLDQDMPTALTIGDTKIPVAFDDGFGSVSVLLKIDIPHSSINDDGVGDFFLRERRTANVSLVVDWWQCWVARIERDDGSYVFDLEPKDGWKRAAWLVKLMSALASGGGDSDAMSGRTANFTFGGFAYLVGSALSIASELRRPESSSTKGVRLRAVLHRFQFDFILTGLEIVKRPPALPHEVF